MPQNGRLFVDHHSVFWLSVHVSKEADFETPFSGAFTTNLLGTEVPLFSSSPAGVSPKTPDRKPGCREILFEDRGTTVSAMSAGLRQECRQDVLAGLSNHYGTNGGNISQPSIRREKEATAATGKSPRNSPQKRLTRTKAVQTNPRALPKHLPHLTVARGNHADKRPCHRYAWRWIRESEA